VRLEHEREDVQEIASRELDTDSALTEVIEWRLFKVSTFTILHTLHEAGYNWQKDRTWCHTGRTLKKGRDGTAYQSEDPYMQEKKS
jgi:hypothetical protein